ncbi:MAG: hypothetical protein H6823_09155 [Planctomycetaceae bacterium]|nr:hypothetical protein [Planctomycetales bacterium]MCB9938398.1 hypothetical protein [Planctomycetaceae bacterium]
MSESHPVETHFTGGPEIPDLEQYRPISALVVVAFIASVFSLLAILHPLLWVLPVVAVVISLSAIIRVSGSQTRYSGRGAAVLGLCIATLIGVYAPVRVISRDRALYAQAREKAEFWLSLVQQGRMHEAHQLSLKSDERFQGPGSLAKHYSDAPSSQTGTEARGEPLEMMELENTPPRKLKEFVSEPTASKLQQFGNTAHIEHLRDEMITSESNGVNNTLKITQRFRASGVIDGEPESIEFLVRSTRDDGTTVANWSVGSLELAN